MRRVLFTAAFACIIGLGCSSNADSGKDVTKKSAEQAAKQSSSKQHDGQDSTTMKTFEIRDPNNPIVTISTDFGDMTLELYRDVAPAHADSFVARTKEGFYNGLKFHRVVKNFMIQGGDPKGNGTGNAGYFLQAEFSKLPHQEGTLSMARGGSPNSASSQFFICLDRNRATSSLDGAYTIFGQLLKGFETLHKIGDTKCQASPGGRGEVSTPVKTIYMNKVFLSDADGNAL